MADFLMAKLSDRHEFRTLLQCRLFGVNISYGEVKIDTGAVYSLIPLRTISFHSYCDTSSFNSTDDFYKSRKQDLVKKQYKWHPIRGVTNVKQYNKNTPPMKRDDVAFICNSFDFVVAGYYLSSLATVRTTCDTTGNVLLGMDILKDLDFHCGCSRCDDMYAGVHKGDNLFLGCRKDNITTSYIEALHKYFGYLPDRNFMKSLIGSGVFGLNDRLVQFEYKL